MLCWLCTAAQVMPYVSLCAQKAAYLEKLLAPLNRTVKAMYGGLGGTSITPGETGVLAASEKLSGCYKLIATTKDAWILASHAQPQ